MKKDKKENTSQSLEEQVLKENAEGSEKADEISEVVTQEEHVEAEKVEEPYDGPSVTVNTRYDYKTMKYYNVFYMLHKRHFNIVYIVMGLLSIAFGAYYLITNIISDIAGTDVGIITYILAALFVAFGGYFIYNAFNFEATVDKNIKNNFRNNPVINVEVTLTERGVSLKTSTHPDSPIDYKWSFITEICEIPEYYFLYAGKQPIIVEKDANKIVYGDEETLKQIIADQAKMKPYKLLNKEILKHLVTEEENNAISFVHDNAVKAQTENIENAETEEDEAAEQVDSNDVKDETPKDDNK